MANRVQEIRNHTNIKDWQHIDGSSNPADIASRGSSVEELLKSDWFTGPAVLHKSIFTHPSCTFDLPHDDEELKVVQSVSLSVQQSLVVSFVDRFSKFSEWSRLVKAFACLFRVAENCHGETEVRHLEDAKTWIIKIVQGAFFQKELSILAEGKALPHKNSSSKLDPFVDESGVLRVGGRLGNSNSLQYGVAHPIMLPHDSHVSRLIVRHMHVVAMHQGRGLTINTLRSHGFWIVGCRSLVSSVIHSCVECRKLRSPPSSQLMASLPKERLEPTAPFTICGMDGFGPFFVADSFIGFYSCSC